MRHKKVAKRVPEGDIVHNNVIVAKLINRIMRDGKKATASRLVYKTFDLIGKKKEEDPVNILHKAVQNIEPKQEVKARRVGGASYQIPMEVRGERRLSLAIRWLVTAANARPNKEFHTLPEKLSAEILDAIENKGDAVKKKDAMQRMADANKAFSHFRW